MSGQPKIDDVRVKLAAPPAHRVQVDHGPLEEQVHAKLEDCAHALAELIQPRA